MMMMMMMKPMSVEQSVEWLAGETLVPGEKLYHCRCVHHKSYMPDLNSKSGRRGWKPASNFLSYGTANDS
jgi:hypothetical protein